MCLPFYEVVHLSSRVYHCLSLVCIPLHHAKRNITTYTHQPLRPHAAVPQFNCLALQAALKTGAALHAALASELLQHLSNNSSTTSGSDEL